MTSYATPDLPLSTPHSSKFATLIITSYRPSASVAIRAALSASFVYMLTHGRDDLPNDAPSPWPVLRVCAVRRRKRGWTVSRRRFLQGQVGLEERGRNRRRRRDGTALYGTEYHACKLARLRPELVLFFFYRVRPWRVMELLPLHQCVASISA